MTSTQSVPPGPDAPTSGPGGTSTPIQQAAGGNLAPGAASELTFARPRDAGGNLAPGPAGEITFARPGRDAGDAAPPGRPAPARRRGGRARARATTTLGLGTAVLYLSLIVLIPLAAVVLRGTKGGADYFWRAVTTPDAWAALQLTLALSVLVALINLVMGTVIAWVLVRDNFPGKAVIDTLIDLPFALPTVVAGLVLLALYGVDSPLHVSLAYARTGVLVALLFVTLPFVVRTVQPVLHEFDRDMEQAAHSLGAGTVTTFRRIVLPNLLPAMVSGAGLAFVRAIAEYGSTSMISGNIPGHTQIASVVIYGRVEGDDTVGAAAISTFLLAVALVVLLLLEVTRRWRGRRG